MSARFMSPFQRSYVPSFHRSSTPGLRHSNTALRALDRAELEFRAPFVTIAPAHIKPRLVLENRPRLGKTAERLLLSTPNQVASVAKY